MASLRALECLVAVADSGSITQAARLLHSSQPAVSHQLASLERETKTALFSREPRGVKLTPAGRAAVEDARRAIEAAASAIHSARNAADAHGGTLRLACVQSLAVSVVAPAIREWRRRRPNVAITLRESTSWDELIRFIDDDEADVLLIPGPAPERFTATTFAEEEIVLSAPLNHRLAKQPTVSLSDLDGEQLIQFAPGNGLGGWLDRCFAVAGTHPKVVMRTSVTAAAPQLAAAGLGVAVTPVSAFGPGFHGVVRSFAPRWCRPLVAVTSAKSADPLAARFVTNLQGRGLLVPADIRAQLDGSGEPPTG